MVRKYDPNVCPACKRRSTRNFGDVRPKRWTVDRRPYLCTHCSPETCHGDVHAPRCRPARPLCRVMRGLISQVCTCPAYAFPHRRHGGACGRIDEWYSAQERRWHEERGSA